MPRIRTIQPHFARSRSMGRVSRDARLLFVLLWTVVDDHGRCHADPDNLASVLYPHDFDAAIHLRRWLAELEHEGCIERYAVDDIDYLRVARWHKHQRIYHPTRSYLPPPPLERLSGSEIREDSGNAEGGGPEISKNQTVDGRSDTFPETAEIFYDDALQSGPREISRERVLGDLDLALRKSLAKGVHTSTARYLELMGRHVGLWPSRDMGKGPHRKASGATSRLPSPAEVHGIGDPSEDE